jgi:branched-chain amino acid transport system substrate-binding protein
LARPARVKTAIAAALAFALLAPGLAVLAQSEDVEPIVIGAPIAKSGWLAQYDGPPMRGVDIAIAEVNEQGGILGRPLELITSDTKTQIDLVATAGIELLDQGIEFMVASCDFDFGAPAAIEANDRGIVAISACAGSLNFGPRGIGPLAFTMSAAAATNGAIMAEWAYQDQGMRSIYVLEDPTIAYERESCAGFRERWAELGGELAGQDTFQQADTSIAPQVSRISGLEQEPDAIYVCSFHPGMTSALRQIRGGGIETTLLTDSNSDGEYWKDGVPGISDLYFPAYGSIYGDDPDDVLSAFYESYEATTGEKPVTAQVVTGYSVIEAFKIAAERAGTTEGVALAAELEKFTDEPLLIGETTFDSENHMSIYRPMRIMQIQDGVTSFVQMWRPQNVPEVNT